MFEPHGLNYEGPFLEQFRMLTGTVLSADPALQQIGRQALENFAPLLESHAIYPFTTCHGWTAQQVQWLRQRAEQELNDKSLKIYVPL